MSERQPSGRDAYPLPDDLDISHDGFITAEELVHHFDADHDGKVSVDDFLEVTEHDKLDRNLERIKERRSGRKGLFRGPEGLTFLTGLAYGIVFFGLTSVLSAGMLGPEMNNSVWLDETISGTFFDPGGDCLDSSGVVWVNVWVDNDQHLINMRVHNIRQFDGEAKALRWVIVDGDGKAISEEIVGNISYGAVDFSPYTDGAYTLEVYFHNLTGLNFTDLEPEKKMELVASAPLYTEDPHFAPVEISTNEPTFPWESGSHQEARISEGGERICLTLRQLGAWGWGLMTAELAGGRETAMLTGGSAGVPAWWMAFVSLSLSVFFLFIQYPLMYRFYHKEIDDILSEGELRRVVQRALERCENDLHLKIEWSEMKMRKRDLSVDVLVPYRATQSAVIEQNQVTTAMLKEVLADFKVYGELTPLQLKAKPLDDHEGAFESLAQGRSDVELPELNIERPALVQDYTDFFSGIHNTASLEKKVKDHLAEFMKKRKEMENRGDWIGVDESRVAVRLIYKPKMRFSFFKFGKSYVEVQEELKRHLTERLADQLGGRDVVVSCRNEVATLADRSGAGRTESGVGEHKGQAFVARQDGLAGTILQSQFMGDILSSVEYVAHENREKIDKWGFWGLIIFVWIPFMASGVLVGAMMGLVARMPFLRVLTACFVGGAIASITWAYTAESIIEVMHALNAELFIPIMIGVIFIAAIMHIRTNKRRRREELFKGSLAFFSGIDD